MSLIKLYVYVGNFTVHFTMKLGLFVADNMYGRFLVGCINKHI